MEDQHNTATSYPFSIYKKMVGALVVHPLVALNPYCAGR